MTPDEITDQKKVEYYSASVTAWFNTSLEHDKSLFALSAGGIGLLITLLTTVGLTSAESLVLYIGAILSFVTSLIAVLAVFKRNRTYIEGVISGKCNTNDSLLTYIDSIALIAFGIGVLFTAVIGISAAVNSYSTKGINMSKDDSKKTQTPPANGELLNESFNGIINLQPSDVGNSFNRPASLAPQQTTQNNTTQNPPLAPSQEPVKQSIDKK